MKVYELASGDFLVISPAGIATVCFKHPYRVAGGLDVVRRLRVLADTIEEAGKATGPLQNARCCPA